MRISDWSSDVCSSDLPAPRLVWNASASAPTGFWRIDPGARIDRGDMVLVRTPDSVRQLAARRHYLPANVPLLKRVVARDGSKVCALGSAIFIDGRLSATRKEVDRRSEEHTAELQSLMRISYAVF